MSFQPYIALTDKAWFDHLASISEGGRLDEVNFWSPKSTRQMKRFSPGEPVFFRLKSPFRVVVGYGFFAHFAVHDLDAAWELFGEKNGDPEKSRFLRRIGEYRGLDLSDPRAVRSPLGCTILRDAMFWEPVRWKRWGEAEGWKPNTQRGDTEDDPVRASSLLAEIGYDQLQMPEDLAPMFEPVEADERELQLALRRIRVGQGTFRSRLLGAYGRCAITGERTEPVLDAAHVQPYLGPRSNHIQNGLLLSKEFHALFDEGLVTVTPDFRVRVSPRIHERWNNGRRYYEFDHRELVRLPEARQSRPSPVALRWHNERIFERRA